MRERLDALLGTATRCCRVREGYFSYKEKRIETFIVPVHEELTWLVHYELNKGYIWLHMETETPLRAKLREELAEDEMFTWDKWDGRDAYRLRKEVRTEDMMEIAKAFTEMYNRVSPAVNRYMLECMGQAGASGSTEKAYGVYKDEKPSHINVIDELHADENAHTRILLKILKCNKEVLRSFIEMAFNKGKCGSRELARQMENAKIEDNREYIDGLIEDKTAGAAIIIENKINWADDQWKQIERYIDTVKKHGIREERIYAVYLTLDGRKTVKDKSLMERARKALGMGDGESGRFIPMDYKTDVLPWMKEVLPTLSGEKEKMMRSAMEQYIDHIEGRLNMRRSENGAYDRATDYLLKAMNVDTEDYKAVYEALTEREEMYGLLRDICNNRKERMKRDILKEFDDITKESFGQTGNHMDNGYYQLFIDGMPQEIHFEWMFHTSALMKDGLLWLYLHTEKNEKGFRDRLLKEERIKRMMQEIGAEESGDDRTVFQKGYELPDGKSFATLSRDEQKRFLWNAYEEAKRFIPVIREVWSEYHGSGKEEVVRE